MLPAAARQSRIASQDPEAIFDSLLAIHSI
jgi:hypothetical protein